MAATLIDVSSSQLWYGTEVEILLLTPTAGQVGFATDTQTEYTGDGAAWVKTRQGTAGAAHVTQATLLSGEDQTNDVLVTEEGQFGYQVVPVTTQTDLETSAAAPGDFLHKILVPNATTAVAIHDGAVLVHTWTITAGTEPNVLEINAVCLTAWKLTCTGAGATAIGRFS